MPKNNSKMATVELGSHCSSNERYRKWAHARKRYEILWNRCQAERIGHHSVPTGGS